MNELASYEPLKAKTPRGHAMVILNELRAPKEEYAVMHEMQEGRDEPRIKPELYAAVAHFLEETFPAVEAWIEEHPNLLPQGAITYGPNAGEAAMNGVISLQELKELLIAAESSGTDFPEDIFMAKIRSAISGLINYASFNAVPGVLEYDDKTEKTKGPYDGSEKELSAAVMAMVVFVFYGGKFGYRADFNEPYPSGQGFVSEGANTAGEVMPALAMVAPIITKKYLDTTSPEAVAQCREALFSVIADLTSVHINEFIFARDHMSDGILSPHTLLGLLLVLDIKVIEGSLKISVQEKFIDKITKGAEEYYAEDVVRKPKVICPAMMARTKNGEVVNKFLWKFVSRICAMTYDTIVDHDAVQRRMVDKADRWMEEVDKE